MLRCRQSSRDVEVREFLGRQQTCRSASTVDQMAMLYFWHFLKRRVPIAGLRSNSGRNSNITGG
jgi:hypothetical protein